MEFLKDESNKKYRGLQARLADASQHAGLAADRVSTKLLLRSQEVSMSWWTLSCCLEFLNGFKTLFPELRVAKKVGKIYRVAIVRGSLLKIWQQLVCECSFSQYGRLAAYQISAAAEVDGPVLKTNLSSAAHILLLDSRTQDVNSVAIMRNFQGAQPRYKRRSSDLFPPSLLYKSRITIRGTKVP